MATLGQIFDFEQFILKEYIHFTKFLLCLFIFSMWKIHVYNFCEEKMQVPSCKINIKLQPNIRSHPELEKLSRWGGHQASLNNLEDRKADMIR